MPLYITGWCLIEDDIYTVCFKLRDELLCTRLIFWFQNFSMVTCIATLANGSFVLFIMMISLLLSARSLASNEPSSIKHQIAHLFIERPITSRRFKINQRNVILNDYLCVNIKSTYHFPPRKSSFFNVLPGDICNYYSPNYFTCDNLRSVNR